MEKTTSNVKMRSRRGCLVCRRRKVKCDETHPSCSRCIRLRMTCEWHPSEQAAGTAPLQRSRQSQACERCRARRMKCEPCDPSSTQGDCRGCYYARVQCIKRGPRHEPDTGSLPPPQEIDRLVNAYFTGPHHFCFYTFIHPGTFRRLHAHGRIPIALLLAVLATSLRCIEPDNQVADEWAHRSLKLVMEDTISRMSALNLQAILLLARYQWHLGAHSSSSLLAAMAQRMVYDLQLNKEPRGDRNGASNTLSSLVLETRRRLTWSTFVLQDLPDAGGHQPALPSVSMDPRTITVQFPEDDFKFSWTQTEITFPALSVVDISPVMIPLLILRHRILRYSIAYHPRNEASTDLESPWQPSARFASLLSDLETWRSRLPPALYFDEENLMRNSSCLTTFLTLHCIFHVVYTDLFGVGYFLRRRMLESKTAPVPDDKPPESFLVYCDFERRQHAFCILDILVKTTPRLQHEPDPFVAICAGVAFRILCLEPPLADPIPSLWPSQHHIDVTFDLISLSAKWSKPIQRLFVALAKCAANKEIHIEAAASAIATENMRANAPCPASPTMRHLGTDATIRSYLTTSDKELIPPDDGEVAQTDPSLNDSSMMPSQSGPLNHTERGTDEIGLSPTTQEMLDFWWTNGQAQFDSPDLFDLNMWLDLDNR